MPVVGCGHGQFQCEDRTCIAAALRCDGRPDCRDRSDEYNCGKCHVVVITGNWYNCQLSLMTAGDKFSVPANISVCVSCCGDKCLTVDCLCLIFAIAD